MGKSAGPPGSGKSTTVRTLAAANGLEVCEWVAPTPTSWEDHLYLNRSGEFVHAVALCEPKP